MKFFFCGYIVLCVWIYLVRLSTIFFIFDNFLSFCRFYFFRVDLSVFLLLSANRICVSFSKLTVNCKRNNSVKLNVVILYFTMFYMFDAFILFYFAAKRFACSYSKNYILRSRKVNDPT